MKYRVLMKDVVNDRPFNFAMIYEADGIVGASTLAMDEFPSAMLTEVKMIPPSLKELLEMATKATEELYSEAA